MEDTFCHFDWELFALVAGPIISLIAVIIYGLALRLSPRQNKVLLSQNIKPNFEKEIAALEEEAKEKKYNHATPGYTKVYNNLSFTQGIIDSLNKISNDEDYREDLLKKENGEEITWGYLEKRNYWPHLLYSQLFIWKNSEPRNYFLEIKKLLKDIQQSQLIVEDKVMVENHLRRKLLKTFLNDMLYIQFTNSLDVQIPLRSTEGVKWESFADSKIYKDYLFFHKKLIK